MASDEKKLDPEQAKRVQEAGAAALNEVISQSLLDLVMNATEADLRGANEAAEVAKGNTKPACGWCHYPATFEFLALAHRRLIKTAEWNGMPVKKVTKVHAKVVGKSKVLHIRAADENDRTAYPLSRSDRSSVSVNLFDLLGSNGLLGPAGYKERFDVYFVPRESPLWPGLLIDLGDPKERVKENRSSKKSAALGKGAAPGTGDDQEPNEDGNT